MQKAKREDFRIEEELRSNKAKYEESSEDVLRRMQDIKDAEVDSVRDLGAFLDAELDYHERCVEELRRAKREWVGGSGGGSYGRPAGRSRSNTAHSYNGGRLSRTTSQQISEEEPEPEPVRMPIRSSHNVPDMPVRPTIGRSNTFQGGATLERVRSGTSTPAYGNGANMGAARAGLRPVGRIQTGSNVFADDADDTASGSGSPEWGERSASPATSYGSMSRSTSTQGTRKAPPPPPPSRSKKPPPPIPAKRELTY